MEVKRRKTESFESLFRRYMRRMQESGKALEVKKNRFHSEKPSKTKSRVSALRREEKRKMRDYLLRSGKLREDEGREPRRS